MKPKWPRKHCKGFEVPLYGGSVYCFKTREHFEEATKYLDVDLQHEGKAGTCAYLESDKDSSLYLIGVFDGELGTLVHELAHIAIMIVQRAGFNSEKGNGEPYCYLLGYLFEILEEWVKSEPPKQPTSDLNAVG